MTKNFPIKVCKNYNEEYKPTGGAQLYCESCHLIVKRKKSLDHYYKNHDVNKVLRRLKAKDNLSNNTFGYLFTHAKNRAKKRGIEFSLSKEDVYLPDQCPVLGTSFVVRTQYAMSLDRIDSTKGYIKNNVQVISKKANTMKSNASEIELKKFADWVYASSH